MKSSVYEDAFNKLDRFMEEYVSEGNNVADFDICSYIQGDYAVLKMLTLAGFKGTPMPPSEDPSVRKVYNVARRLREKWLEYEK